MAKNETSQPSPFPDFLLGHTFLFGGQRYRLENLLGGGLTAMVFRGVLVEGEGRGPGELAFKFARDEERYRRALKQEWQNLLALEQAERKSGTHYFPRAPHPIESVAVPPVLLLPGQPSSLLTLGQEFVSARGVHDLLLDHAELRLPERLALEIGRQYAELLAILHGAGLTCADRKLGDLRWQPDANSSGKLTVVDWNVTAGATPATISLDLFRFGFLWHRMLLGSEPRFRRAEGWQLEEPVQRHPVWQQLSFGSAQILARLLHPEAEERYRTARELLHDFTEQVTLWSARDADLEPAIKQVHRRYVDAPDPLPLNELRQALAAVDVLRVRGTLSPALELARRALYRAVLETPFSSLKTAIKKSQLREATEEASRLLRVYRDPALLLQVERYAAIATQAARSNSSQSEVKPLLEQSDRLFLLDAPEWEAEPSQASELAGVSSVELAPLREWLAKELAYRQRLAEARSLKRIGQYREAENIFRDVLKVRRALIERSLESVARIDQLYGDPTSDCREVEDILKAGHDVEGAFKEALVTLRDEGPHLEEALGSVADALRCEPANPLLARLHRLLIAEERYREASDVPNEIQEVALKHVEAAWKTLSSREPCPLATRDFTDLRIVLESFLPEVEETLMRRRGNLFAQRARLVGRIAETQSTLQTYLYG